MKDKTMKISGDLFAALTRDPFYGRGAEKMIETGKWKISDNSKGVECPMKK